jgi:hypothetical protein
MLSLGANAMEDRYLTTAEVAERYRTVPGTVRYWRHSGTGPRGTKIGRKVLYLLSECIAWERERDRLDEDARNPRAQVREPA